MMRFLAFTVAVLGSGVVLAQAPDYAAEGGKALDAKNYAAAVELFTKAVAADPKDYTAHFNLALSYSLLDRYAEAVPEYKLTLELHPGLYDAQLNLGICLVHVKDAEGAIAPLKAAVEQKPKEYRPIYTLAQAQLSLRDWASAEISFSQAIALNASSPAAEEGLGEALMHESKLADAEAHFRKAASINAEYKPALLQLGELYEQANEPAQAIAIYREFPENIAAQERMGVLLKQSGDAAAAIPALENAVAKSPTPANRVALAQAYVAAKNPAKAIPLAAAAVAATPDDYDLRLFYGRLLRDERRPAEAAPQFLAASKLKPDAVQPWNELSGVLITAEQYPQALQALERVFALHAETPAHYYFRAISYDHLHVKKEALANYKKFLELSQGQHPDEEFKARQRARIIQNELNKP
jgi:tetratricopeptide (TPR) repeat protein